MNHLTLAIAAACTVAAAHVLTPALEKLPERHHALLASVSGGAGLAYVTLYLLYELTTEGAAQLHRFIPLGPAPIETLFVLLLAALAVNYMVQMQLQKTPDRSDDHHGHAILFLIYNLLVGAGMIEEARWGGLNLIFYAAALGTHMLSNDLFLHHVSPASHTWQWRAGLAAAPPAGCLATAAVPVPDGLLYAILAYVAGGTIINVLRFELPGAPTFRPFAFATGITLYAGLIFATWRF